MTSSFEPLNSVLLKYEEKIRSLPFFFKPQTTILTMKTQFYPFVGVMQNLTGAVQDRHRSAAIAIGYACACNSQLPSAEVDNAEEHYLVNVESFTKRVVSALNEVSSIDTSMAIEFARKFWLLRYEAVHKCPRMGTVPNDFFASVFGVPKYFSPETVQFANTHAVNIGTVYMHVCNMIADHFLGK